jgi:Tfp pilus assembly protein PilF
MRIAVALAALTLSLAACAQAPKAPPGGGALEAAAPDAPILPAFQPTPGLTPAARQRLALNLLERGEPDQARAELHALLEAQPANATARKLLDQIDRDPKALLGEKNFSYRVRAGESLSALAQRFLGDPLMFYALARYNGVEKPGQMEVGQTLLIPGAQRKAPAAAAGPPTPAKVASRNPARAAQLRSQGLEQLNRGSVEEAVASLRQAQGLDPANATIQRDLDRAVRIQQTVRGQLRP